MLTGAHEREGQRRFALPLGRLSLISIYDNEADGDDADEDNPDHDDSNDDDDGNNDGDDNGEKVMRPHKSLDRVMRRRNVKGL